MARWAEAPEIYRVADLFRERCLTNSQSLLWPDHRVWTPENLATLYSAFIDHPDATKRSFFDKWRDQLRDLPIDIQRLATDVVAVYHLFPTKVNPETKLGDVVRVIGWQLGGDAPDLDMLRRAYASGIGAAGTHYQTGRRWQIAYIIRFAKLLIEEHVDPNHRESSQRIADRAREEVSESSEMRQIMLHLLFPDYYERIASIGHKATIVQTFRADAGGPVDVDAALLGLRQAMQPEFGEEFDFYIAPVRSRWQVASVGVSLQQSFESLLANYDDIRTTDKYSTNHLIWTEFERICTRLKASGAIADHPSIKVEWSVGNGRWAAVPWIALLDARETKSTQEGVYCVYLFRADMTGVYLTLNQGVTTLKAGRSAVELKSLLRERAEGLRQFCSGLVEYGYSLDDAIDLRVTGGLGAEYEASTAAYKFYEAGAIPSDEALLADVREVVGAYEAYLQTKLSDFQTWVFQANPKTWDLAGALNELTEWTWLVTHYGDKIRAGDKLFLWQSGEEAGALAMGTVMTDPTEQEADVDETKFAVNPTAVLGKRLRVRVRVDRVFKRPILRQALLLHPVLSQLTIIRAAERTNVPLRANEQVLLEALIDQPVTWCAYMGREASSNFEIALRQGIWGNERASAVRNIRTGDRVKFAFDATSELSPPPSGYPRAGFDTSRVARFVEGNIVSGYFDDEDRVWPDKIYRHRFQFDVTRETANVSMGSAGPLARPVVEAFGQSVNQRGPVPVYEGVVVPHTSEIELIGAGSGVDIQEQKELLSEHGRVAVWWSFGIRPEYAEELGKDFILNYYTRGSIVARYHVVDIVTGTEGTPTPWPTLTLQAYRSGTKSGEAKNEQFRTWLLVDKIEEIAPETLKLSDFDQWKQSGPLVPQSLIAAFAYVTRIRVDRWAELATKVYRTRPEVIELKELLEERHQLIFYGPPGTGKTFVAKLFGEAFRNGRGACELIQFHPSYSYEEFVEGLRPSVKDGHLEYDDKPGRLVEFVERARKDRDAPYVLVIDEINRANLAKVFGELFFLLEYRGEHVTLPYSRRQFSLPHNFYVIGTMNTADRSIALVDFALRRRFGFVPFYPSEDMRELREYLGRHDKREFEYVADMLAAVNRAIQDRDYQIGHSYFMLRDPAALTAERIERTWRYSIEPYVREYWYEDEGGKRAEGFTFSQLKKRVLDVAVNDEPDDES